MRAALAVLTMAVAGAASSGLVARDVGAQAITLPTVRAFGPGPEEVILFRLIEEQREFYRVDTLPDPPRAVARRSRMDPRLQKLLLAPVTQRQLEQLVVMPTEFDSLRVLAGDRYMPDDAVPTIQLRAIVAIGDDPRACVTTDAREVATLRADVSARVMAIDSAITRSSPGMIADTMALAARRTSVIERAVRVACALEEVRQRDPALFLSEERIAAVQSGRALQAAKLDSLMRIATAVVILRKIDQRMWAPVVDREQAAAFWRQRGLSPLNVGSVTGSSRAGVSFTEIASPLLQMLRVSVSAVLVAEEEEEEEEDATPSAQATTEEKGNIAPIQRLLTGGGLFNVGFAWPAMFQEWQNVGADVMLLAAPRFGVTAPVLGVTATDSTTVSMDAGLELHAKMIDLVDGVGVVGQVRWANARGSRDFISSLGISGTSNVTYATASVGLLFDRQYMLTASRAIGGPRVIRRTPWQIGMTVIRLPAAP